MIAKSCKSEFQWITYRYFLNTFTVSERFMKRKISLIIFSQGAKLVISHFLFLHLAQQLGFFFKWKGPFSHTRPLKMPLSHLLLFQYYWNIDGTCGLVTNLNFTPLFKALAEHQFWPDSWGYLPFVGRII